MSAPAAQLRRTKPDAERRRARGLIKRSASRRATPLVVGSVLFVMLMVVGVLLEQVLMAQSAFKLGDMRSRLLKAEARHEELMLEATRLESPTRIETYARTRLGMVDPNPLLTEYVVADIDTRGGLRVAQVPGSGRLPATGRAAATAVPGGGP